MHSANVIYDMICSQIICSVLNLDTRFPKRKRQRYKFAFFNKTNLNSLELYGSRDDGAEEVIIRPSHMQIIKNETFGQSNDSDGQWRSFRISNYKFLLKHFRFSWFFYRNQLQSVLYVFLVLFYALHVLSDSIITTILLLSPKSYCIDLMHITFAYNPTGREFTTRSLSSYSYELTERGKPAYRENLQWKPILTWAQTM